MKKTVSIWLLNLLIAFFCLAIQESKAQTPACCAWMENTNPAINPIFASTLKAPSYKGVDEYEVKFLNSCNLDPATKISIVWEVYKDNVLLNLPKIELDRIVKLKLETTYTPLGRLGGELQNGAPYKFMPNGSQAYKDYPGALAAGEPGGYDPGYWNIANIIYNYDYIYLHYFMASHTYFTISWIADGNYEVKMYIVKREGGTDWGDLYYNQTQGLALGGHQSHLTGEILAEVGFKPAPETDTVEKSVCANFLPFQFGNPVINFYRDTTCLVAKYSDIDCNKIDSVFFLKFTVVAPLDSLEDTTFYFCQNSTPDPLEVEYDAVTEILEWSTDGITWTDTVPVPPTDIAAAYTYYVHRAQAGVNPPCWSKPSYVYVNILEPTPSINKNDTVEYCKNATPEHVVVQPSAADWLVEYSTDNGATWTADPVTPSTDNGNTIILVRQTDTTQNAICPSVTPDTVFVFIHDLPVITKIEITPKDTVCLGTAVTMKAEVSKSYGFYTWTPEDEVDTTDAVNTSNYLIANTVTLNSVGDFDYKFTVTDTVTGCSSDSTITVTVNPVPEFELEVTGLNLRDHICAGDTATIAVTPDDFDLYAWEAIDPPNITLNDTTNYNIKVSIAGTYRVTVTNEYGCTASKDTTMIVDALPVPAVTPQTPEECSGTKVTFNGSNNSLPFDKTAYLYEWNTGKVDTNKIEVTSFNNSNSPNTTSIILKVTDRATGCFDSDTAELTVNPLPEAAIYPTRDTTICKNATIELTGLDLRTGGLGDVPYSVYWSSTDAYFAGSHTDNPVTVSFNTPTYGNPHTVQLRVTNVYGCTDYVSKNINVNDTIPIIISHNPKQICLGESVQFVVSHQTGTDATNYPITSIKWSNDSVGSSIWATPDVAGFYYATVTVWFEGNACPAIRTDSIKVNSLPKLTFEPFLDTACYNSTSFLHVICNNFHKDSLNYVWSGYDFNLTSTADTAYLLFDRPGENMIFSVRATHKTTGCVSTIYDTVYVRDMVAPDLFINRSPLTDACSGNTVILYPNVSRQDGYTFYWNNSTVAALSDSLPVTVTLTDASQKDTTIVLTIETEQHCKTTATINLTFYPIPEVTLDVTPREVCQNGTAPRTITTTVTPGAANAYQYRWSTGAADNNKTFITLPLDLSSGAHYYTVTVTSEHGCEKAATDSIVIWPVPNVRIETNPGDTICAIPGNTVVFEAMPSGGTPGYSYQWSSNVSFYDNENALDVDVMTTTTYQVTVTDSKGCRATASKTITAIPMPSGSIGTDKISPSSYASKVSDTICSGSELHIAFWTMPVNKYNYVWSTGYQTNNANISIDTIAPTVTGKYYVTVSNPVMPGYLSPNGCFIVDSINVVVIDNPTVTLVSSETDNTVCLDVANDFWIANSSYQANTDYNWVPGAAHMNDNNDTIYPVITVAGTYTQYVTVTEKTSSLACTTTDSLVYTVLPKPVVDTIYTDAPGDSICAGSNISITVVSNDAVAYAWAGSSANTSTLDTVFNIPGNYDVLVTLTSADGCVKDTFITVTVMPLPSDTIIHTGPTCKSSAFTLYLDHIDLIPNHLTWRDADSILAINIDYVAIAANTYNAGKHVFYVGMETEFGCTRTATDTVTILPNPEFTRIYKDTACTAGNSEITYVEDSSKTVTDVTLASTVSQGYIDRDFTGASISIKWHLDNPVYSTEDTLLIALVNITASVAPDNCVSTWNDTLFAKPKPDLSGATFTRLNGDVIQNAKICGDTVVLFKPYVSSSAAGYTYDISGTGNDTLETSATGVKLKIKENGTLKVTNTLGCESTISFEYYAVPEVTINASPLAGAEGIVRVCSGQVDLTAIVTPGGSYDYQWYQDTVTQNYPASAITGAQLDTYSATASGHFMYTVEVTDQISGCPAYSSIPVYIDSLPYIDVTNVGHPNEIIYTVSGTTGSEIKYDVLVNRNCWNQDMKVKLKFDIQPKSATTNPLIGDYLSTNSSITYKINSIAGDHPTFVSINSNTTFHVNLLNGEIPRGEGGGASAHTSYFMQGADYNFDWLYLHFLNNRPVTVAYNNFIAIDTFLVTYTLVGYPEDLVPSVVQIPYSFGPSGNNLIGGYAPMYGAEKILATRQITIIVTAGPGVGGDGGSELGIVASNERPAVDIYPNPAKNNINIEFSSGVSGYTNFAIYNLNGQLIDQFRSNVIDGQTITRDVNSYSSGVYFVKISNNDIILTKKIVISK